MGEQDNLRWVHAVGEEPIPEVVSGSTLDKLSQVVDQLQGAVELLSSPCGTPDAVRRVGRPFRCSVPTETRDAMASVRPRIPIKKAPGAAAVLVTSEPKCLRKGIRPKCLQWEHRELAKQLVPK
ncbi:hypothetical protein DPMN_073157 [Dreissena polymorpha]|uniref:Uncharacterized protein n=1 Tax=Dreissena polymorpha TaxID=45954 RepID=A0A9D4HCN1_DREPO|nr:hypothetical protein DPMN_073157 [Dreissena polymorpha]